MQDGPASPSLQGADIVCAHIDNPGELCATGPRTASRRMASQPLSPGLAALSCRNWVGPNVTVALCSPQRLRAAIRHGRLDGAPSGRVRVVGRAGRAAQAPGIVQMAGRPLRNGDRVNIAGALKRGTTLTVRMRGRGRYRHRIYIARFANIRAQLRTHAATASGRALRLHVGADRVARATTRLGGMRARAVARAR
jgi:hypothetical protein